MTGPTLYGVFAYQRGRVVCEIGTLGKALPADAAAHFARDLRGEFPDVVIALLPAPFAASTLKPPTECPCGHAISGYHLCVGNPLLALPHADHPEYRPEWAP